MRWSPEDASFQPTGPLILETLDQMHSAQGAALLEQWNLPESYCRVVREHHTADFDDNDTLLLVVRVVDIACRRGGVGLNSDPDAEVASSAEAQVLRVSDVLAAELEIAIEDALEVAAQA